MFITVEFMLGSEFSDCVYRAADLARRLGVDAVKFEFNGVRVVAYASAIRNLAKRLESELSDAYKSKDKFLVIK